MSSLPPGPKQASSARLRLFFDQTGDADFLVLVENLSSADQENPSRFTIHTFPHEDLFLQRLIAADLPSEEVSVLAGTVLLSIQNTLGSHRWVELSLSAQQLSQLGLLGIDPASPVAPVPDPLTLQLIDETSQFHHFLTESPTPFALLSGPEHRVTFVNQPYVELLGRSTRQEILGKPIREVLTELAGQPFFRWLDQVYRTGVPFSAREQVAHMRSLHAPGLEDRFFDFVYFPVRNAHNQVHGVMVQAADVTEKVQTQAVADQREQQLFFQWAELDAIYRASPTGMALLDAKTFKVLRINEKQANLMGATVAELLGKTPFDLKRQPQALADLFARVAQGIYVTNAIIRNEGTGHDPDHRAWLVNISPFLGAAGEIIAFTCISLEIPGDDPAPRA